MYRPPLPLQCSGSRTESCTAVIAYAARYYPTRTLPFAKPCLMLLKVWGAEGRGVAGGGEEGEGREHGGRGRERGVSMDRGS